MKARGTDEGELVALLSATGAQTETVPPSLVLITIGSVTSVSITSLFIGGLVPSAVLGVMLCLVVWWRNRKVDLTGMVRQPRSEVFKSFVIAQIGRAHAELQSLMRTSYAVFCLKKKQNKTTHTTQQ